MFHAATNESTAAPSEETTVVPPGKTTNKNNMEKEQKRLSLSVNIFLAFALVFFLSVMTFLFLHSYKLHVC